MTPAISRSLILIGAMCAIAVPSYAQQSPTDAAKSQPAAPTASGTTASPAASPEPSATPESAPAAAPIIKVIPAAPPVDAAPPTADTLKKARQAGYHTKIKNGRTMFCIKDADIGSHFVTEKCVDQETFLTTLRRDEEQREALLRSGCGPGGCSNAH